MKVTDINFKSNFEKLVAGLVSGNDVSFFTVDKETEEVGFLFGEYNVTLKKNGTWEIC